LSCCRSRRGRRSPFKAPNLVFEHDDPVFHGPHPRQQLGQVSRISSARAQIRLQFKLPFDLRSDALVHSTAETNSGPVELHEILLDNGSTWQLDRMWWSYLPVDAKAAEQH
jgi:hypothetical protein